MLAYDHHETAHPFDGYEASREAAMQASTINQRPIGFRRFRPEPPIFCNSIRTRRPGRLSRTNAEQILLPDLAIIRLNALPCCPLKRNYQRFDFSLSSRGA
jgi:hypothetical protein